MIPVEEIATVLPDPTVLISKSTLSCIDCLIPNSLFKEALLLYRKRPSENLQCETFVSDIQKPNELDITGSPLEYELCYPGLDETIVDDRNWKKEEESYLPLAISEARSTMNYCRHLLSKHNWSVPLFAICDGKDSDKTVLLGSNSEEGWFTTLQLLVSDARRLSNIQETPAALLNEYTTMYSIEEEKVRVDVTSTYELCGKRPGIVDLLDIGPGCFNGNLSIKMNWKSLSFYAPIRDSSTTLVMEIIAGWSESHLKNLWRELTLLHQYLNLLEQCERNVQTSHRFTPANSITWIEIEEKLNSLLHGEVERESSEDHNDREHHRDIMNHDKFQKHVDNVQFRRNMDFADIFWELLTSCADYEQVTKCVRMVIQAVQSGSAPPQTITTNSTRIIDIIFKILNQKGTVLSLDQISPLELLIDAGLEKLSRDYTYILLSTNLIDLHDIQQMLHNVQEGEFNIESYRKKLTSLAQIHLCLEFTLFAENYLSCLTANLLPIFGHAFRKYASKNSTVKSLSDLLGNKMQCLQVPLPTIAVEHIIQGLPSSWSLTLTSQLNTPVIARTCYLSRTPVLPPNLYYYDEPNELDGYHLLELNLSSMKFA